MASVCRRTYRCFLSKSTSFLFEVNIIIYSYLVRRLYMAENSIITKMQKFFIGSLSVCSYRLQYPKLKAAPTEVNASFEKLCDTLAAFAERRYAEMKAAEHRITADKAEIYSLICEILESERYVSILFTYFFIQGGRCCKCKRFSIVLDSISCLAPSPRELGISRRMIKKYDGFYMKNGQLIGYRSPDAETARSAFPPNPSRMKALFCESEIATSTRHSRISQ